MYENKYRSYLEDESFHRQYLRNEDEPVGSSLFSKLVLGSMAVVGGAAGLKAAYRRGLLKAPMQNLIEQMGKFKGSELQATLRGIRNWSEDDARGAASWLDPVGKLTDLSFSMGRLKGHVDDALTAHRGRMGELSKTVVSDETPQVIRLLQQRERILESQLVEKAKRDRMTQQEGNALIKRVERELDAQVIKSNNMTIDQQEAMLKRTGYRQLTVQDMIDQKLFKPEEQAMIDTAINRYGVDFAKKIVDPDMFIDGGGKISDIRNFKKLNADFMNSLAEDFSIPFIQINPIKMFYLNDLTDITRKPNFAFLSGRNRQPLLSNNNQPMGRDTLYVNGKILDLDSFNSTNELKVLEENAYLVNAKGGALARLSRNMFNITLSSFKPPASGIGRKAWYETSRLLDIGFQDEPIKHRTDLGDPASPFSSIANKFHHGFFGWGGTKPYKSVKREKLDLAFGSDPDWLVMRNYQTLEQAGSSKEYFKQFTAGRQQAENVTTASFFYYGLFERLNSTLAQVGLGLSTNNLGSGHQIFGNLVMRRALPVWATIEGYKYLNYEFENFFGEEFEDKFARFYANAHIAAASAKDSLGLTDMAKEATQLMPGIEFLSELPLPVLTTEGLTPVQIGDLLAWDKTAEETKEWYEEGYSPMRSGRYWEFGNTPYTGGSIDYFQNNWYQRITSDWEYTETLWGSKDEYWENHAMPTLRNPLAPLRHFVTDPYHWEEKHYYDRPYPLTGGIPEIQDLPLVGPLLNATIGQVFKPTLPMHEGWQESRQVLSQEYELATAYGLIEAAAPQQTGILHSISQFFMGVGNSFSGSVNYGTSHVEGINPMAYVTSGGSVQVAAKPSDVDIRVIQDTLNNRGLRSTTSAEGVSIPGFSYDSISQEAGDASSLNLAAVDFYDNLTDIGGFYGWMSSIPVGSDHQYDPRLETSQRAYGYQRRHWDLELGNIGGDANEIFRRALPPDNHKNYVNGIRNTMPSWMPGDNYFIDFKHGDPYVKVNQGEMRLPGHSYEKMYGIDPFESLEFHVDPALVGRSPKEIVQHLTWRNRLEVPEMTDEWKRWASQEWVQEEYYRNFQEAVSVINQLFEARILNRGDFYEPIDRYRILADVAPYSEEFRAIKAQLAELPLSQEERAEITAINQRVSRQKEKVRTYDYRFQTAEVENKTVTVTRVLTNNMILTQEHPDNPIKLAGVYVPEGQNDPVANEAREVINNLVRPGMKMQITVTADEANLVNQDTYQTIDAVVRVGQIRNLNQQLIAKGLAQEEQDDYSPAAVHARFTPGQIQFGSMWESFAHLDTPFHTKLLQVRSPLEQYERREVYGKDWQDWTNPVEDFVVPWYQNWISKGPIAALGIAGLMGYFFGTNRFGKTIGAFTALTATGLGLGYRGLYETMSGETWVPERRERERDLEEYMDILSYVKNKALFEKTALLAIQEEGTDVKAFLEEKGAEGSSRKSRIRSLEEVKRKLFTAKTPREESRYRKEAVRLLGGGIHEDIMYSINQKIEELKNVRYVDEIGPIAAQAITYYNEAESTMYGYDPGDPISNVLSALPKKERQYLSKFMDAPEQERDRILEIVPSYVRRILQATWGLDVEEKPDLIQYFQKHELPDENWVGWDPRANLDHVRIKMVQREGLDQSEFDIWQDDINEAAQVSDKITPELDLNSKYSTIEKRLRDILKGAGLDGLQVRVAAESKAGINVNVDVQQDMRNEIVQQLNEHGYSLLE